MVEPKDVELPVGWRFGIMDVVLNWLTISINKNDKGEITTLVTRKEYNKKEKKVYWEKY